MICLLLAALVAAPASAPDSSIWNTTETVVAVGTVAGFFALMPFDEDANSWAAKHHSEPSRIWAAGAKVVGDGYITIPVSGALWYLGAKADMPRLARASRNALESWCLTELSTTALKYSFHRARPSEAETNQEWYGPGIGSAHLSFPSGHSASAWGLLPGFAMEFDDHPILVAALYATAASTSLSRVHDGEHWMSDVFFSAGAGYLSNRLVRSWNARRDNHLALVPLISAQQQGLALIGAF